MTPGWNRSTPVKSTTHSPRGESFILNPKFGLMGGRYMDFSVRLACARNRHLHPGGQGVVGFVNNGRGSEGDGEAK
jgi:hypothetical protein